MSLRRLLAARIAPILLLPELAVPRAAPAKERPEPVADGSVRLVGTVADRMSGEPIPLVSVEIAAHDSRRELVWSGLADGRGRFLTDPILPGSYELRVDGRSFSPVSHLLLFSEPGVVDLRIEMVRARYELEPVVAVVRRQNLLERAGFYDRLLNLGRARNRPPGD